jgi:hypothetical protein
MCEVIHILRMCAKMQCCGSGSETFGRIRIRSRTEINILDPDSNPAPKPDPKKIRKKEPYIQAKVRWFHTIIHISHLHVVVLYVYA